MLALLHASSLITPAPQGAKIKGNKMEIVSNKNTAAAAIGGLILIIVLATASVWGIL